ncbi:MAG: hypothetical protein HQ492_07205 [Woeseiaceae bacterium]|nr:hypothetical protein [Woeseiaceae bacterium]
MRSEKKDETADVGYRIVTCSGMRISPQYANITVDALNPTPPANKKKAARVSLGKLR